MISEGATKIEDATHFAVQPEQVSNSKEGSQIPDTEPGTPTALISALRHVPQSLDLHRSSSIAPMLNSLTQSALDEYQKLTIGPKTLLHGCE